MLADAPRHPTHTTPTDGPEERRQNGFRPDPCSGCGHDQVRIMLHTEYVLYVRCERCLTMHTVPKPGQARFGA